MSPRPDGLSLSVDLGAERAVITLAGELDLATVGQAAQAVGVATRSEVPEVVLDLREVHFMDSSAIHLCADLDVELRAGGRQAAFVVSPTVRRVLQMVGMDTELTLRDEP